MQISFNGIAFLKKCEGFRDKAYKDTGGVWTIGYGTTKVNGKPVEAGMTCTEPQATAWLGDDLAWAQTAVNKLVRVALKQNQFDALVSFVYNVGEYAFMRSTMLRLLNANQISKAADEFDKWIYDNGKVIEGLKNRRRFEKQLFTQ